MNKEPIKKLIEKNSNATNNKINLENAPIKGLTKRYSKLKNLINDRSTENTNFLENLLQIKSYKRPEEIKAIEAKKNRKKQVKNIISLRMMKFFKLWEIYSKRKHFRKNMEKLKKKTFFANSLILQNFQFVLLLNQSDNFRNNEKIYETIDLKELLTNPKKIIPLIEMDINKKVFNFFSDLKKNYDFFLQLEPGQSKEPNKEFFFKKRTYSLNYNQSQIVIPIEKGWINKGKERNHAERFILYNIIRFFEDLYQLNLNNFIGFIDVKFYFFYNFNGVFIENNCSESII